MTEEEHAPSIKIVDRRRFTAEGASRDNHSIEDRKKPTVPAAAKEAAQASRQQAQKPASAQKSSDFLPFVASLATNAMAAMGAIPQAKARGMPVDPELAREYMDIILMLQERTVGNLSPEEDQALQRLTGELKKAFAETSRAVAAAPMPPPGAHPMSGMRR